jgi:hypothetical protein
MENQNIHHCIKCHSIVTDLVSVKVENDNMFKLGKNIDGNWICDDCNLKKNGIRSESIDYSIEETLKPFELASKRDVSPNTPPA